LDEKRMSVAKFFVYDMESCGESARGWRRKEDFVRAARVEYHIVQTKREYEEGEAQYDRESVDCTGYASYLEYTQSSKYKEAHRENPELSYPDNNSDAGLLGYWPDWPFSEPN
jgi:hypothetical protein